MSGIAKWSLAVVLVATVLLLAVAGTIVSGLERSPPPPAHLAVLKFDLDIFKAVLGGFAIASLGILVPAAVAQARERFEQRRESRRAYSEAKTGVDYLKLGLAAADLQGAVEAIRDAHLKKHMAELYDDFPEWLRRRYGDDMTPAKWDDLMYGRLFAARLVLEGAAAKWNRLGPAARIALLEKALPSEPQT